MNDKKIKIDFHGNIDYFYLIKGVAYELNKTDEINNKATVINIIEKYIERNFGGIKIDIDRDINKSDNKNKYLIAYNNEEDKISSVQFLKIFIIVSLKINNLFAKNINFLN